MQFQGSSGLGCNSSILQWNKEMMGSLFRNRQCWHVLIWHTHRNKQQESSCNGKVLNWKERGIRRHPVIQKNCKKNMAQDLRTPWFSALEIDMFFSTTPKHNMCQITNATIYLYTHGLKCQKLWHFTLNLQTQTCKSLRVDCVCSCRLPEDNREKTIPGLQK
jgi:hypothetical protein